MAGVPVPLVFAVLRDSGRIPPGPGVPVDTLVVWLVVNDPGWLNFGTGGATVPGGIGPVTGPLVTLSVFSLGAVFLSLLFVLASLGVFLRWYSSVSVVYLW